MNKIIMYWFKMPNGHVNFGDEVGPYIVSKLSGYKVCFFNPKKRNLLNAILYKKDREDLTLKNIFEILFKKRNVLVSVGSILNHYNLSSCDVWGSGIIKKDERVSNANFYAVRGKHSQQRLKDLGYKVPKAIGDPALLLPIILPIEKKKSYRLGIIPHYVHYEAIKDKFNSPDILIINLLDPNIENIVEGINSCDVTISSSLHGLIVSHTYNIPSLWYHLNDKPLFGDNIKFDDYFSSVGIHNYKPFILPKTDDIDNLLKIIVNTIKSETSINSIQIDLKEIQENLLASAPFKIKKEFLAKV